MCLSSLVCREPPLEWKAEGSYCNIIRTSHPFQCVNPHLYANAQYGIDFIKDIIMFAAANQTCPIDVFSIWKCGRQYSTVIAKITPRDVCRDAYHLAAYRKQIDTFTMREVLFYQCGILFFSSLHAGHISCE